MLEVWLVSFGLESGLLLPELGEFEGLAALQLRRRGLDHELVLGHFLGTSQLLDLQTDLNLSGATWSQNSLYRLDHEQLWGSSLDLVSHVRAFKGIGYVQVGLGSAAICGRGELH